MNSIDFHGTAISITAPESLLDALDDRFGHFPMSDGGSPEIAFDYRIVTDWHAPEHPAPRWRPFYKPAKGEALYAPDTDEFYLDSGEGASAVCRAAEGICTISVVEPLMDKRWLLTHPFVTLPLMEILKRSNRFTIHAAGVARKGRSILICGTSGAGKTTLTVALVRAGFDFMGDDLTLLTMDPNLKALAFPEVIDITGGSAAFFPELRPLISAPKQAGWPKHRLRIGDYYPSAIARETAPAAIVFPRIANTPESRLLPLSPTAALLDLSASVLLTDKRCTAAHLEILGKLTQTVPCYRLLTGNDFDAVPRLFESLL